MQMRLISLNTLALLMIMFSCDTQRNVEPVFNEYFTKYYGEDGEQSGVDLVRNDDGSMLLLGNSFSQTDLISPFIVKTDPQGNVLWQREFLNDNETAVDIQLINGGTNVAVLTNVQRTKTNICIYLLGQDGNLLDSLYVNSSSNQVARSLAQSSDDGFLITGYKDPNPDRNPDLDVPPVDEADILLLKIDNALSEVKDLSPGGGEHVGSGVNSFEINLNNSVYYLVFGYSDRPRKLTTDYQLCFQLIASNIDGVPTGLHEYSDDEIAEEQTAASTLKIPAALGDGYLVVGTTTSGSSSDLYLTRFAKPLNPNAATKSLDGRIPLNRRIEGVAAANAAPDGYFVIANEVRENNKKDIFLLRVERDGAVSWSRSFGSLEGEDTAGGIEALPDGRIAVVGTIQLETQRKMALIVTNGNGAFSD
jgi:hypothetical protein